jgi:hypothetical protein
MHIFPSPRAPTDIVNRREVLLKAPNLSILLLRSPRNEPELPQIRNLSIHLTQFQDRGGFECLEKLVMLNKLVLRFSTTRVDPADTFDSNINFTGVKDAIVGRDKDIQAHNGRWNALVRVQQDYCVVLQITIAICDESSLEVSILILTHCYNC